MEKKPQTRRKEINCADFSGLPNQMVTLTIVKWARMNKNDSKTSLSEVKV